MYLGIVDPDRGGGPRLRGGLVLARWYGNLTGDLNQAFQETVAHDLHGHAHHRLRAIFSHVIA
jgi:hypothetical protein